MTWKHWLLIGWLALSALIVLIKGIAGSRRTYTEMDGLLAVVEVGLLIWLVTTL